jgi:transposase
MVRWNKEKVIDLACIDGITIPEIAERLGVHHVSVERFLRKHREELQSARAETSVCDRQHAEVLTMWGDMVPREEIARRAGVSMSVVRRLILSAEFDETPEDKGAGLELLALMTEHPGRFYEDDLRALTEYGKGRAPMMMLAPDTGMRSAA